MNYNPDRYYSADPRFSVILRSKATKNPFNFARKP